MSGSTVSRRPWFVLAACWLVSVGYNAHTIAPASVLPLMAGEFGVNKATAGLSISAIFLSWVALQLPGGFLMDRYDNRRLVGVGVGVFVVASVGAFLAESYPLFVGARLLGGAAAVFIWTANANIVSRAFPADSRAFATSLFVASAPGGFALAQFAGPLVAEAFGWRAVFVAYPLLTLLGLPLFVAAVREPVRNETTLSVGAFVEALRNPAVLVLGAASFCAYSLFLFFNSWMPAYATEVLGVNLAAAGAAAALVPLSSLFARPGGGWLSDRLDERRRPVVLASFLLSLPALAALSQATTTARFTVLLLLAGFVSQVSIGVFYVYVSELSPDEAVGTALAVLTTLSVAGALVTPVLTGWLIEDVSWTAAFGYAVLLGVVGLALTLRAPPSP